MDPLPYIIATAGHVDHGKSSLVRALTGTDPDRLPEEKARGMTIDLGFAYLRLPSPPTVSPGVEYDIGIIDVPGHEDFVRNMVAGVGCVDVALLVVAGDDGWMPQTEEHLQILTYLGVRHGAVVFTKSDLPHDARALQAQVADKLRGTCFQNAPMVATSVHTGEGLSELRTVLAKLLATVPPQADVGLPRVPVDRIFVLKGVGTVLTGTLTGGSLARGQTIVIQSQGHLVPGRVRNLQHHHHEVVHARPGSRVAINVPDVYPAATSQDPRTTVHRGDVVTVAGVGSPVATLDVQLWRMDRETNIRALPHLLPVQIHLGSSCIRARVLLLESDVLPPGGKGLAQLRLEHPTLALAGDRMVVRDSAGRQTLAGAVVLDPLASRRRVRDRARLERLSARAANPTDVRAWITAELHYKDTVPRGQPLAQALFNRQLLSQTVQQLINDRNAIAAKHYLLTPELWHSFRHEVMATVDAWHQKHPEQPGLTLTDLRAILDERAPWEVVEAVVESLTRDGYVRHEAIIRRGNHRPTLPPRLQAAGERLRTLLLQVGLSAPTTKQLAPDPISQQALRFLLINGEAIEVSPDTVISTEALSHARQAIRKYILEKGPATVAQLKTALASCRRIMVPLLERLDREGLTVRQGDVRIVEEHRNNERALAAHE